jgi:hypothetical protein
MNIRFGNDDDNDLAAVKRLNLRLAARGRVERMTLRFRLAGEALYRPEGFPVYRRLMIAEEGGEVRAAMLLYHNNLFVHGKRREFCWADMPISEGLIDRAYSLAIVQLYKKALDYQPFLMTLGVERGGAAYRFLSKLGWRCSPVPFFFYPVNATKVFLGLKHLQNHGALRYAAQAAACLGIGAGLSGLLGLRRRLGVGVSAYENSQENVFGPWADRIFEESLNEYGAAVRSDAASLNIIYSPDDPRIIRLRIRRKGTKQDAGWIIVVSKQMKNSPHFGDLKVGTLVDGFGRPADLSALVAAGLNYLAEKGNDIVIANFSHSAWGRACRRAGMFPGPTNYDIFVSPGGAPLLQQTCPVGQIHATRGHGDGLTVLV